MMKKFVVLEKNIQKAPFIGLWELFPLSLQYGYTLEQLIGTLMHGQQSTNAMVPMIMCFTFHRGLMNLKIFGSLNVKQKKTAKVLLRVSTFNVVQV